MLKSSAENQLEIEKVRTIEISFIDTYKRERNIMMLTTEPWNIPFSLVRRTLRNQDFGVGTEIFRVAKADPWKKTE